MRTRSRTAGGNEAERGMSKRNCTAVATLLTFCPPGPEERMKESSISFSSSSMPCDTLITGRVYGAQPRRTTTPDYSADYSAALQQSVRGFGKLMPAFELKWQDIGQNIEEMTVIRALMKMAGLTAALILSASALAHHGWSEYDASKPLTLTGAIKASGYEHPHGHISLETPGKTWQVILAPPSRMERRGLPKDALKPGAQVTVTGYANRDKPDEMRAERIIVNGKTVELR